MGIAGLTALQGLRDTAKLQPGERVLINGASGGVGTLAIQIAKALGGARHRGRAARATSSRRARSAPTACIDRTREDFTRGARALRRDRRRRRRSLVARDPARR